MPLYNPPAAGGGATFPPLAADLVGLGANMARASIIGTTLSTISGDLYLQFLTAHAGGVSSGPLMFGSTSSQSGMTLYKIALFEVEANGDLTRVAITADLGATQAANTIVSPPWITPPTIVVGKRYAIGVLAIHGGAGASFRGVSVNGSAVLAYGPPYVTRQITGQTDILASYSAASQAFLSTNIPYCAILG